ncbi:hypothetical protein [Falsirhodobacter algicola]|uniref:hypothetical protein n=1 Tax=Falsirhodobacter algicola TaxID=2692330 RepID=UPI001BA91F9E|nr:hypothetical protein [Falsirhodobacter algicola]
MTPDTITPLMPAPETSLLREAYEAAQVILEYGIGGSTVMASGMSGTTLFGVESDAAWAERVQAEAAGGLGDIRLHVVDIGAVGRWGRPKSAADWPKFHRYATTVWDRADFVHPDIVLIDGVLRPACFAACALRITRPVTVLFDDYRDRRAYHAVERIVPPLLIEGRLAVFELEPGMIGPADLTLIQSLFGQVNYAD